MTDPLSNNPDPRAIRTARWLLAVLGFMAMSPVLIAQFTWIDDAHNFFENPRLNPATWSSLLQVWTSIEHGLYIPVTQTLWTAIASVSYLDTPDRMGIRLNPWLFHTASLLLHVGSVQLVFLILQRLRFPIGPAALGAGLFAVHPMQVETIGWTSGMKDLLAWFLAFAALAIWLARPVESIAATWRRATNWLSLLLFVLAGLSKPVAMILPAWLILIDFLRQPPVPVNLRTLALRVLRPGPMWIVTLALAISARLFQEINASVVYPVSIRPLVAADAIAFYLYKLLIPIGLTFDYARSPDALLASGQHLWTWTIPASVLLLFLLFRKQLSTVIIAALIALAAIAPMLGLTRFQFQYYSTVADHYVYGAMLGIAIVASMLTARFWQISRMLGPALLILLGILSFMQMLHWRDQGTISQRMTTTQPDSFLAWSQRGLYVERFLNDYEQAYEIYLRAVNMRPENLRELLNLAAMEIRTGRHEDAAARVELCLQMAEQIGLEQDRFTVRLALGSELVQFGDFEQGEKLLREAWKMRPWDTRSFDVFQAAKRRRGIQ